MIPQLDVPSGLLEGSEVGEARQTDFFDGRANKIRTLQPKKTSTALHHGMRLRDVEEDALPGLRSGGGDTSFPFGLESLSWLGVSVCTRLGLGRCVSLRGLPSGESACVTIGVSIVKES